LFFAPKLPFQPHEDDFGTLRAMRTGRPLSKMSIYDELSQLLWGENSTPQGPATGGFPRLFCPNGRSKTPYVVVPKQLGARRRRHFHDLSGRPVPNASPFHRWEAGAKKNSPNWAIYKWYIRWYITCQLTIEQLQKTGMFVDLWWFFIFVWLCFAFLLAFACHMEAISF